MSLPLDVLYRRADNVLEVSWEDGSRIEYPVAYLRGWCPCARCQGHGVVTRYRPPTTPVSIASMWEVGAYAIGIEFSDGHDEGIFRWSWLRKIAPDLAPVGMKYGRFVHEAYLPPDLAPELEPRTKRCATLQSSATI